MRPHRSLAHLFSPSESETELGGREISWSPLGDLWLRLEAPRVSEDGPADTEPIRTETRQAESRADPRVAAGQRVVCDGAEWRLDRLDRDRPRPGRMTLILKREI